MYIDFVLSYSSSTDENIRKQISNLFENSIVNI